MRVLSLSSFLYTIAGAKVLLPYYHMISDEMLPHVRHLYRYKTTKEFEHDLDVLLRDFHPISLEDLVDAQLGRRKIPPRAFHLSFDDGFAEMQSVVAPLLRLRGVPATFFVCSAFVDNRSLARDAKASLLAEAFTRAGAAERAEVFRLVHGTGPERLTYDTPGQFAQELLGLPPEAEPLFEELQPVLGVAFSTYARERRPYLDGVSLESLVAQGFSIGAHSVDHPRYDCLTHDEQLRQTYQSMEFLTSRLGLRHRAFAFPYSDNGVSDWFFLETKASGRLDLSFGAGGLKRGPVGWHLQRLSFETPPVDAGRILRSAALRSIVGRYT